jgi:protein TonB
MSSLPPYNPSVVSGARKRIGLATLGAIGLTLTVFLVLPLTQTIRQGDPRDLLVRQVDIAKLPPPPPPPPEQEEDEPDKEPPPQLAEKAPPLDLSQLELALNPGFGDGLMGDFTVKLAGQMANGDELDEIFSMAELDQQPRVIFQTPPLYPAKLRQRGIEGTVYIVFLVDRTGRVVGPKVERSTDPRFDQPALNAVKQWKFEPGMRNGQEVQFKMRVPITFSQS